MTRQNNEIYKAKLVGNRLFHAFSKWRNVPGK